MKIKDLFSPLFFIVLGTAFLAVTVWVWFSNGKNTKAIKTKYKLGGMILTLSFFTTTGCGPTISCYDPIPPDFIYSEQLYGDSLYPGDTIFISIQSKTYQNYSYSLSDSTAVNKLQEGILVVQNKSPEFYLPINKSISYKGKVKIDIYGEQTAEIKRTNLVFSQFFNLYAPKN